MVYCRDLHGSSSAKRWGCIRLMCGVVLVIAVVLSEAKSQNTGSPGSANDTMRSVPISDSIELRRGVDLTRQGRFNEAIPFLLKAQTEAPTDYAAGFNLALCYLGVGNFKLAIRRLNELHDGGSNTAAVNNLLSQAYVGDGQYERAFQALHDASRQTPKDEKLYAFVADACTDHFAYNLGLRVVNLGLQQLPESARLHYERALFLARLDRFDEAEPEFAIASKLAPGSDLSYLALIQEKLYEDKLSEAEILAREGIKAGHRDYQMLSLLGTVLMHAGAAPGQSKFAEAREALEDSVALQPAYSTSQIALGKLYLMEGHPRAAVLHLEVGRRLEPRNPAVYTSLTRAYRQLGDRTQAQESLAVLSSLLHEKTSKTSSSPR